jgi:hypothetical protein
MASTVLGDQYVTLGVGTTAQRPGYPTYTGVSVLGMTRWNTDFSLAELYDGTQWSPLSPVAYNTLSLNAAGALVHTQIFGTDSNTSVVAEDALSAFFSGKFTLGLDSSGNLTATY